MALATKAILMTHDHTFRQIAALMITDWTQL